MRLAFLTPAPNLPEPWRWAYDAEAEALLRAGAEVVPIAWTEAIDLAGFDLVLPLLTWGYHRRFEEWHAFLDRLESDRLPVRNPPKLLRWNSDKSYLTELADSGVPTVPTLAVDALDEAALNDAATRFATDRLVAKPAVSAGADGTIRLSRSAGWDLSRATTGRMMVQPYLPSIAAEGEYSLMFFGGEYSHSVVKVPAGGDFRVQPQFGGQTRRCDAPEAGIAVALDALAVAPVPSTYARVDLVRGDDGELKVIELELIEPALFLHVAPECGQAFSAAIIGAARRDK